MTDRKPMTLLLAARSRAEAQIVLALLRSEDIVAYVNGEALADEFAASQRLLGLQGTRIEVREEDLPRARRVLDEARRSGNEPGE